MTGRNTVAPMLGIALAMGLLAGCSNDQAELRDWMDGVRKTTQPVREKIVAPKEFEPFRYERGSEVDPFVRTRLAGLSIDGPAERRGTIRPDAARQRELLESYPLDAIRMVGHMTNGRQSFALLQVDSMVHQARVGNHAGQNHGVITGVAENQVRLREMVQDAAGDWVHRETTLQLQEGGK
jgi:type IV pilus assembly protein PilP